MFLDIMKQYISKLNDTYNYFSLVLFYNHGKNSQDLLCCKNTYDPKVIFIFKFLKNKLCLQI